MGVTVTNLTAGPGDLYTAAFGASEASLFGAAYSVPASATWTDAGGTMDGVKLSVDQNYFELEVDQVVDVPGRRLTKREFKLETNFAEPTLQNLAVALNDGTVTASAGAFTSYDPANTTSATQQTYKALIFDGWAPGITPVRRRVLARRTLSVEGLKEMTYKKDAQTGIPVTFAGHYVSASTVPFKLHDFTS
jgi:hypothetical protein